MLLLLGHGNDLIPLPWYELLGNWTLALVAFGLTAFFSHSTLAPIFTELDPKKRTELAGWVGMGLAVLIATGAWITRQSLVESVTPPRLELKHRHTLGNGGQMAMWGDYHAELARSNSGEYRLWLNDAYERPISSTFFEGKLVPRDPKSGSLDEKHALLLDEGLDKQYRFALMPREIKSVQAQLSYPGGTIRLNFVFDESRGKRSVLGWCGPRHR